MRFSEAVKAETDWLDPINRTIIQAAVKHRTSQMRLRDDRVFNLTYSPNGEQVKIKPVYGIVPQGTFPIKKVLDPDWTSDKE